MRSGADIFARNEHGRTPRQEAEVTLTKIESDSIGQTIHFLVEEEKRREEQVQLKVANKLKIRRGIKIVFL